MKLKYINTIFFLVLFLLNSLLSNAQTKKEIIGYYPSWKYYARNNLFKPANIKYDRVTILNYAFFAPSIDGTLKGTDAYADTILLKGENDWVNGGYKPNTSLIDLAHKNNVKVMVSIGGWTLSNNFSPIAADPVKRAKFAAECVRLIKEYKFDGIDIDWEYPGFAEHNGRPEDKINYTKLLQEIKNSLNAYSQKTGKKYLLTAALSANASHIANLEVEKLNNLLDMFNIMTYDFSGPWETITGHNSPLYNYQGSLNPGYNVDAAYKIYTQKYKIPTSKINIGIAFYGRAFAGGTALNSAHTGGDLVNFPEDEAAPTYYEIKQKISSYNRTWDNASKVPYLTGKTSKSFVTYDDEESVCIKADYVMSNNLGGVIIWEITGDYLDAKTTPLQDQIYAVFNNKPCNCERTPAVITSGVNAIAAKLESPTITLFPNPSEGKDVFFKVSNVKEEEAEISLFDIIGNLITNKKIKISNDIISLSDITPRLASGVYFLRLHAKGKEVVQRFIVN